MKDMIVFLWCGLMLAMVGCASTPTAKLAGGNDTQQAVTEVTQMLEKANQDQVDLLAHSQYEDGKRYMEKAQTALAGGYKPEIILENASIAKAYFLEANKAANKRRSYSIRLLGARQSALDAGLLASAELIEGLEEVDDDLRDDSDLFSTPLKPTEFSQFQKQYLDLEIKAVQYRELNDVDVRIRKAEEQDADDLAPKTLNTALLDYADARNIIELSPRNPENYRDGVNKATYSSVLLEDVMEVILNAEGTPESVALQIVNQNRKLSSLSEKAGKLEANLKSTQTSLIEKSSALLESEKALMRKDVTLEQQEQQLRQASTQVRFQRAMDLAREQFLESEALVYQQGANLVFRLKKINFRSGSSTVPEGSKSLLREVNTIIAQLQAENVVVQGHTDSVGSDKLNKDLSTRRANSVAKFLNSLRGGYPISYIGYGEAQPIASNDTAAGRAINRRVDLIVSARK